MNTFIQFINEEKQRLGLSTKALFEAGKSYVFKNGKCWLVESSDEETVEAVESETEQQRQFTPEEFEAQIDSAATQVVQKQKTVEQQQKQAAQTLQQIAMQKIAQGQSMCDDCEECDKEAFEQGQQMIQAGHELLKQAQQAQEEIAAQQQGEEVSVQVQQFQKAAQQVQDSVKILGTVINDLIPPSEQITIPQLAKQSEILVRANAIADSANDVFQTAVQKQQQIVAQADEELKAELESQMCTQLNQEDGDCVLSKEQQKLQMVAQEIEQLIDTVEGEDLEVVKQCGQLIQNMSEIIKTITDETFLNGQVQLNQNEDLGDISHSDKEALQDLISQSEEASEEVEAEADEDEQEVQPTELFQQKLEKAKQCLIAQQVALAQVDEVEEGVQEQVQKVVDMIEQAQEQIEKDAEVEEFAQQIDELAQQIEELSKQQLLVKQDDEEVSLEDIASDLEEIKQILAQFVDNDEEAPAQESEEETDVAEQQAEVEEEQQETEE